MPPAPLGWRFFFTNSVDKLMHQTTLLLRRLAVEGEIARLWHTVERPTRRLEALQAKVAAVGIEMNRGHMRLRDNPALCAPPRSRVLLLLLMGEAVRLTVWPCRSPAVCGDLLFHGVTVVATSQALKLAEHQWRSERQVTTRPDARVKARM